MVSPCLTNQLFVDRIGGLPTPSPHANTRNPDFP